MTRCRLGTRGIVPPGSLALGALARLPQPFRGWGPPWNPRGDSDSDSDSDSGQNPVLLHFLNFFPWGTLLSSSPLSPPESEFLDEWFISFGSFSLHPTNQSLTRCHNSPSSALLNYLSITPQTYSDPFSPYLSFMI